MVRSSACSRISLRAEASLCSLYQTQDPTAEEISTAEKDKKESLNKEIDALSEQRKEVMEKFASDNVLIKQITDLALLSNNMLKGKELNEFVNRSLEILK